MLLRSPIFRLSVGLILLTVSLLLVGDLLGLTPDQRRAELAARKSIAEALAVQVSGDVAQGHFGIVDETLRAMQQRSGQLDSIGLRAADGRLIATAGDHLRYWKESDDEKSTATHVRVPIHSETGKWGVLELSYKPVAGGFMQMFQGGSIATVILFVSLAGFVVYWLFLKRALHELDPSAVVPDRVHAALDVLSEGVVILDKGGRIVLTNAAFDRKLGSGTRDLMGSQLSSLNWQWTTDPEQAEAKAFPWQVCLDDGATPDSAQLMLRTALKEFLTFTVNVSPVKAANNEVRGVLVTFDDLTELERKNSDLVHALGRLEQSQREITRQNRELQVLATRDPLTGSLNRRSLFDGMATLLNEAADEGEPLSCIMVDIDHFKSINDRFGHATGDKVIKMLARILADSARAEDLVGRYGGEEFCVVLPGVAEEAAAEIAERMRLAIYDGKSARFTSALRISASFGVSTDLEGGMTPGALVDLADKALYHAKESGRNRVVCWSAIADIAGADDGVKISKIEPVARTSGDIADTKHDDEVLRLRQQVHELENLLRDSRSETIAGSDDVAPPNRVVLHDRISQAINRCRRTASQLAILSIDMDIVRVVMNTHGNHAAEKLMRLVAGRLKKTLRVTDTVAVQGGDDYEFSLSRMGVGEFVVMLSDLKEAESATWVIQRVFAAMRESIDLDGDELLLDSSIGVSLFPADGDDPDTLLVNAAAALREARLVNERQVCLFYAAEMNNRSKRQLQMETQLHHAIEKNELYLEYQPGVDMRTGRIINFEALLRWRHPEWGLVRPDEFIPIAEHAGLIEEIGDWVMQTAMRQLKSWHDDGFTGLSVAVNFSAVQFRDKSLVERVVSSINEIGVSPEALVVEITESALIQNLETAVAIVGGLSEAGLRIALDDFGTGYSSLSYLKRFAIDVVKIDRSFLCDFPVSSQDTEIVSAIIAMAHTLGLRVVAEGVENDQQLQILQHLDCDEIQGYLFSKPVAREDVTALLSSPADIRQMVRSASNGRRPGLVVKESPMAGVLNEAPRHGFAG